MSKPGGDCSGYELASAEKPPVPLMPVVIQHFGEESHLVLTT